MLFYLFAHDLIIGFPRTRNTMFLFACNTDLFFYTVRVGSCTVLGILVVVWQLNNHSTKTCFYPNMHKLVQQYLWAQIIEQIKTHTHKNNAQICNTCKHKTHIHAHAHTYTVRVSRDGVVVGEVSVQRQEDAGRQRINNTAWFL